MDNVEKCGFLVAGLRFTVFYAIQYCIENTKRASRALVYSNLQRKTQISGLLVPLSFGKSLFTHK